MSKATFGTALVALLLLCTSLAGAKEPEPPRCEHCGMLSILSSTHIVASFEADGKSSDHEFCSTDCLHQKLEEWEETAELSGFEILDFSTYGTDEPQMIDGLSAWYLFGTKPLPDSMGPFAAAFASKDAAEAASKELGGELAQGWDGVYELMEAAEHAGEEAEAEAAAAGPGSHHSGATGGAAKVYVCPCTGDCCLDIQSDKPGECPRCGMTLVLKDE
jgi:hypothetical protein